MPSSIHQDCELCRTTPTFGAFCSGCIRDGEHFSAERRMGWYALGAAVVVGALAALASWGFLDTVQGFTNRVLPFLPYIVLGTVATGSAAWHLMGVRRDLGEMTGMMGGMTFGMIGGFLAGYLVGATNGMFTGCVFGVLVGCGLGWYVGGAADCCGLMPRMEGLMAGFMAGLMGAMTSVMLLNDRILWFTPFFFAVCFFILFGMTYLVHREHRERQGTMVVFSERAKFLPFTIVCIVFVAITIAVMLFGPMGIITFGI